MKKANSTLGKKLKQYSALAAGMVAASGLANAQVVYTDVNPDKVLTGMNNILNPDTLELDLNNDGIFDYLLFAYRGSSYTYQGIGAMMPYTANNSNAIAGSIVSLNSILPALFVSDLPLGKNIDDNLPFYNLADIMYDVNHIKPIMAYSNIVSGTGGGEWLNVSDRYIGFKFQVGIDTNFHYGWARCSVSENADTLTLKEYAYEATINTGLFAGQGSPLGLVAANHKGSFKIMSFEGVATIIVNDGSPEGSTATLTSMIGDVLLKQDLSNRISRIDLNQFPKGIYLLSVQRGDEIFTKKISFR